MLGLISIQNVVKVSRENFDFEKLAFLQFISHLRRRLWLSMLFSFQLSADHQNYINMILEVSTTWNLDFKDYS